MGAAAMVEAPEPGWRARPAAPTATWELLVVLAVRAGPAAPQVGREPARARAEPAATAVAVASAVAVARAPTAAVTPRPREGQAVPEALAVQADRPAKGALVRRKARRVYQVPAAAAGRAALAEPVAWA